MYYTYTATTTREQYRVAQQLRAQQRGTQQHRTAATQQQHSTETETQQSREAHQKHSSRASRAAAEQKQSRSRAAELSSSESGTIMHV
jgi:hypothetical protein